MERDSCSGENRGRKARYVVVAAGNCQDTKRPTNVKCQRCLLHGVMCLGLLHRARGVMLFPALPRCSTGKRAQSRRIIRHEGTRSCCWCPILLWGVRWALSAALKLCKSTTSRKPCRIKNSIDDRNNKPDNSKSV
jgi:hypothetical protein